MNRSDLRTWNLEEGAVGAACSAICQHCGAGDVKFSFASKSPSRSSSGGVKFPWEGQERRHVSRLLGAWAGCLGSLELFRRAVAMRDPWADDVGASELPPGCWWLSVLPRIFTLAIQALPAFSRLHQRQAVSLHLHSSDFSLQKIDA